MASPPLHPFSSRSRLLPLLLLVASCLSELTPPRRPHLRPVQSNPLSVFYPRNTQATTTNTFTTLDWTSENGEILVNGQPFHLKGEGGGPSAAEGERGWLE